MRKILTKTTILFLMLALGLTPAGVWGISDADAESPEDVSDLLVAFDDEGREIPISRVDEDSYDGYIFSVADSATNKEKKEIRQEVNDRPDSEAEELVKNELYAADSLDTIDEVAEADQIEYIEPDYIVTTCEESRSCSVNDPYYSSYQWYYNLTDVQQTWQNGITGAGVAGNSTPLVAVLDTGLMGTGNSSRRSRHEDLNYDNVISGESMVWSFNGTDDGNGHGSFVTGEIAETLNNNKGIAGMTPDVKICPVKVLNNQGSGTTSSVISGIKYAIEAKADVISMSLGSASYSSSEASACKAAADAGIIVVAAAGNNGDSSYNYPAAYDGVIGVAAVTSGNARADYSQYNDKVDAAAPGSGIFGIDNSGQSRYTTMNGTSMATPIVASLAAMAKSMDALIDHDGFMNLLQETCTDWGTQGKDNYFGYGVVNFAKAMATLQIDLSGCNIELEETFYEYTGSAIRPEVTVTDGETVLESDKDYTLSFEDNTDKGTAKVIATGKGAYKGTVSKSFTISGPCTHQLEGGGTALEYNEAVEATCMSAGTYAYYQCSICHKRYSDNQGTTQISAAACTIPVKEHKYNTESWANDENYHWHACKTEGCTAASDKTTHTWVKGNVIREATTEETGIQEYYCSVCNRTKQETIAKKSSGNGTGGGSISPVVETKQFGKASFKDAEGEAAFAYTGEPLTPEVVVTDTDGAALTEGKDYSLSYSNNIEPGTAKVTVSGIGDFANATPLTLQFTIERRIAAVVPVKNAFVFTGAQIEPAVTVTDCAGYTLEPGKDYSLSYENNVNVGTAAVTASGQGDYKGSGSAGFTINPKNAIGIKATKGKKSFRLTWKKPAAKYLKQITGYEIQYSTAKAFTNPVTIYAKKTATVRTVKKLVSKRTYYVKMRTHKSGGENTYCSAWSKTMKIRTR